MKVIMRGLILMIAATLIVISFLCNRLWAEEIILFEHIDFGGRSITITGDTTNLHKIGWGDRASSFKILSGTWTFYEHIDYKGRNVTLGPGNYRWIGTVGFSNDALSSLKTK